MPIESPCISICVLDNSGKYCLGCYRTAEEVEKWNSLSEKEQKNLLSLLDVRRNDLSGLYF